MIFSALTMSTIFGGRIDDLRVVLLEERLPDGWESRVRKPYGLTIITLNLLMLPVEFGVREADWRVDGKWVEDTNQPEVAEEDA